MGGDLAGLCELWDVVNEMIKLVVCKAAFASEDLPSSSVLAESLGII